MTDNKLKQKKDNRALLLVTVPDRNNEPMSMAYPVKDIISIGPISEVATTIQNLPKGIRSFLIIKDMFGPIHAFEDVKTLVDRANRDDVAAEFNDYIKHVELCISHGEMPLSYKEWQVVVSV